MGKDYLAEEADVEAVIKKLDLYAAGIKDSTGIDPDLDKLFIDVTTDYRFLFILQKECAREEVIQKQKQEILDKLQEIGTYVSDAESEVYLEELKKEMTNSMSSQGTPPKE